MTLVDTLTKQDSVFEKTINKPIWGSFPDTDEIIKNALQDNLNVQLSDVKTQGVLRIPKIKELELLKEGIYSVDLEKTINDMFMVIKNMEHQLESVLKINSVLEKDLKEAKNIISELKKEKLQLEANIARIEEEIPSKREQQIEIDHLVDERNKAQMVIRELNSKIDKLQKTYSHNQERKKSLEDQKGDFVTEINFLESRLSAAAEKINRYEHDIKLLKGEKIANEEKINTLEQELRESLDEKFKLAKDLKGSREALQQLHLAMTDSKLQAKRSFYRNQDDKKADSNIEEKKETPYSDSF